MFTSTALLKLGCCSKKLLSYLLKKANFTGKQGISHVIESHNLDVMDIKIKFRITLD